MININIVYKKDEYIAFKLNDSYIIQNIRKTFREGHAYVGSDKLMRTLIDLSLRKELPRNPYLAAKLLKLTKDAEYAKKLEQLKDSIITDKDIKKMVYGRSEIDTRKCY